MPPRHIRQLPLHERIKDGRIFEISRRTTTGVIYLRCQTTHCGGTAKKLCNGEIVLGRKHSTICYEDRTCQLKADFMHALKTALERNFWRLKVLYETVAALYPREITVLLPYNSIKSTLKRWRNRMYPPNPSCLEEMATQLEQAENSRMLEYDVGYLRSQRILDSLGKIHIILYDPQFVQNEFKNVSRILLDATYKTKPRLRDVYQLFTVLGVTYDHALPFAHILMSSKTEAAYRAVLTEVASLIRVEGVKIVMSDFEQALRNASKTVFSSAHVTGCNVHYDRALLRKINTLNLSRCVRDDEVAKLFVKKLMALAYLPHELIQTEYEELKTALTPALATTFQRFLTYYERQWLGIVKPSGFSVHGLSRRTNNATESYNSVLGDKLGLHPGPWAFLVHLLKLTSNARDDLNSLKLNKRIKRQPRYSTTYKRNELVKAWKQLYSGDITAAEFLTLAASLKGHIRQRLEVLADGSEDEAVMHESPETIPAREDPDYDVDIFEGLRFDDDDLEQSIGSDHEEIDQENSDNPSGGSENEYDDPVDALIRGFEAGEQRETRDRPDVLERLASLERPVAEGQAEEQREAQERHHPEEQQREAQERHQAEEQQREAQRPRETEEQRGVRERREIAQQRLLYWQRRQQGEEQREAREGREAEEQQREAQERREAEEQQREAQERREVEEQQREAQERREAEEQQREAEERHQAEEQHREAQERHQAVEQQREARERHQAEEQQREAQRPRETEEQRGVRERREIAQQRLLYWQRRQQGEEQREAREGREAEEQQREAQERREAEEQQREAQERQHAEEQQREAQERREAEEQQREAQERREAEEQQREAEERHQAEEQHREAQERHQAVEQQREARERHQAEEQQRGAQRLREALEQRGVRERREVAQQRLLYWQRRQQGEEQREARESREAEEQQREAQERREAEEQHREGQERHQAEEQQREAQRPREALEQRGEREVAQQPLLYWQRRQQGEEQREAHREGREAEVQREVQEHREAEERGEAIPIVILEDDDLHSLQDVQARQPFHGRQGFEVNGTVDLTVDTDSDIAPEPEQEPGTKVSRNRNKNRRKKRRRQLLKAGGINPQPRPYGHKRRRKTNKAATCIICLGGKSSHIFCPCGHNCACEVCAEVFLNDHRLNQSQPFEEEDQYRLKCPQCREQFTNIIRVYN